MRLKAKFKHSFDVHIKNKFKVKLIEKIEREFVPYLVSSRRPSFDCNNFVNGEIFGCQSIFSNQDIAYSLLEKSNLTAKDFKYKLSKSESFYDYKSYS